ncbi:MAG: nuclear transport factor 2 family protein [Gammaproteobacteria bacterium]|nr:nuclear transport factor 2 family protein [Gammaproteobacteria bacterium]
MKKWILVLMALLFSTCLSVAWANPTSDENAAKTTIENWFAAMKTQQVDKAGEYLLPQFVSIHTDGVVRTKKQEIALIKNLHMNNYHLSNFKFSQRGDTIVVTYLDKGAEQIDNKPIGKQAAGRMAVLQKKGDKWLILAYANLDTI